MTDPTCDFCQEIAGSETSTFKSLYGNALGDRVLFENQHFICIPTVGQIVDGSLLIVPKRHVFTIASIGSDQFAAFEDILSQARGLFDLSIAFEHGCHPKRGHNCGVYHAHAHIVPVTEQIIASELFKNPIAASGLNSCLTILQDEAEYVLFEASNGEAFYQLPGDGNSEMFTSQYFRKWLVNRFNIKKTYDWNQYTHFPEAALIDVVTRFRSNVKPAPVY